MGRDPIHPRTTGQQLMEAIDTDNYESVRMLVTSGADIDYRGPHGETPLLKSLLCDDRRICRLLLDAGADVNIATLNGYGPLSLSCLQNNFEHVRMLLGKNASVRERTREGWTPLLFAATNSSIFFDNSESEFFGKMSELMYKYTHYHPDFNPVRIVKLLLEYGADPMESTIFGTTPLMVASGMANHQILRMFLEAKSAVDLRDTEGKTALMYASTATIEEIIESTIHLRLVGNQIRLDDFLSPQLLENLQPRVDPQKEHCVDALIQGGADVRAVDNRGLAVLTYAALGGNLAIVERLVAEGAEIETKSPGGVTALHAAAASGRNGIVSYLLATGAEIDPKLNDGETPLMAAVRNGQEETVSLLIRRGADVRAKKFCRYKPPGEPVIRPARKRRKETGEVFDRIFSLLSDAGAE